MKMIPELKPCVLDKIASDKGLSKEEAVQAWEKMSDSDRTRAMLTAGVREPLKYPSPPMVDGKTYYHFKKVS